MSIDSWVNKDGTRSYRVRKMMAGRRYSAVFPSHQLAKLYEARLERAAYEAKAGIDVAPQDISVEDLFTHFEELRGTGWRPRTLERNRQVIRHWLDFFMSEGVELCSQVTPTLIERWKRWRLEARHARGRYNVVTVNFELVLLKSAFNFAVKKLKLLPSNPIIGVEPLKVPDRPPSFYTDEELERILGAMPDGPYKEAYVFLDETGLRRSELLHLEWSDVDLGENVIIVRPKDTEFTKSGRYRAVALTSKARRVLDKIAGQGDQKGWVFRSARGGQLNRNHMTAKFTSTARRLDLLGSVHWLRHSYVSRLLRHRVPINVVQELAGHQSVATTMRYAHVAPDQLQEAARKLSSS